MKVVKKYKEKDSYIIETTNWRYIVSKQEYYVNEIGKELRLEYEGEGIIK